MNVLLAIGMEHPPRSVPCATATQYHRRCISAFVFPLFRAYVILNHIIHNMKNKTAEHK